MWSINLGMGWDFKNCLDQCKSSGKLIVRGYFSSGPISKTVLALFKIWCQYSLNKNRNNFMVWKVKIGWIFFRFLGFFFNGSKHSFGNWS